MQEHEGNKIMLLLIFTKIYINYDMISQKVLFCDKVKPDVHNIGCITTIL